LKNIIRIYNFNDFEKNEAWLMFRLDIKEADDFLDLYMLMHLPSECILGHEIIEHAILQQHISQLLKQGAKH